MKRKLFFVLASAAFLTPMASLAGGPEIIIVEPDYFSGFFVGGTGAFHQAGFSGSNSANTASAVEVTPPTIIIPTPPSPPPPRTVTIDEVFFPGGSLLANAIDGNAYDGFYGVQGGVGKVFNHRWYAGVVGFGEWGDQSDTSTSNANFQNISNVLVTIGPTINQIVVPTTGTYNSSTTVKLSNDYGVAFKPGFLVSPKTMVYGKIGAVWADLEVSNSFSGTSFSQITDNVRNPTAPFYTAAASLTGASSNEENQVALLLGVGVEQFIYRDFVTINVEYNYANYGYVSTSTPLNANGSITINSRAGAVTTTNVIPVHLNNVGVAEASANARVSTLLAGLNFYFGSHWF